jgi:hypothetical protein
VTVPVQTPDEDRARTIEDIATAAALDVYFDRDGTPTIRDVPRLNPDRVVWTVDAGDAGVMTGADRERNRQNVRNLIALTSDRNDGTAPFATQYVWDQPRTVEWHLIDSLTVPLVPSKNAQTITTRSTRPDAGS